MIGHPPQPCMPMTEPRTAAPADADRVFQVPRDTTPTWEVELLLSGALVFSMLQVPGLLDDVIYALRPRLTGNLNYASFMLYFYLKISAYALICTFVLHLGSRAIWVAALGLRSVYPGGVDWEKLKRGPIYRDYAQSAMPTLDRMIDQADNRASLVFAFGLLLALMSLSIMLLTMSVVALAGLIAYLWMAGKDNVWITLALVMLVVVPMMLATLIDRRYGERLGAGHWLRRSILRIYHLSTVTTGGRFTGPIMLTLFSRLGMTRGNLLLMGALYSLMALILVEVMVRAGAISPPGERYLPEDTNGRELRAQHYADTRSERDAQEGFPYIPSATVRGPYLRLFVPYVPRRVQPTIEAECPAATVDTDREDYAEGKAAEQARVDALLDCIATQVHPLVLDSQPVAGLRYDLGRDPVSGLRGFVAMLDVRALPLGRHQLEVIRPQRKDDDDPTEPAVIPFWR